MKKQTILLLSLLTLIVMQSEAQYSFEKIVRSSNDDYLYSTIENSNHQFISLGSRSTTPESYVYCPLVLKIDTNGDLLEEKLFCKTDSSASFKFGMQKSNGNYLIIGTVKLTAVSDLRLPLGLLLICELDTDLNIVYEKIYEVPEPYVRHTIFNWFVALDGTIIIQSSADDDLNTYSRDVLFFNIDMEGNLLKMKMPENVRSYGKGDYLEKSDGTGFYMIGDVYLQSIQKDWMEFDYDFNLISYGQIQGSGFLFPPLSNQRLPNGEIFLVNHSISFGNYHMGVLTLDNDFNILKDTILEYNQPAQLPLYSGIDYTNEDNIYMCSYRHISLNTLGATVFYVHILDAELNVKGTKICGGDSHYMLYSLLATSDAGCILTGIVPDHESSHLTDGYVVKLMPEDILTGIAEPNTLKAISVRVSPNPFRNELVVDVPDDFSLIIYNQLGRPALTQILEKGMQRINTSSLKKGIYFYNINTRCNNTFSGKIIKN
ncbi:MAG: T9SS type A sorting domain-containing protein [Bacteroidales bacterium]|jgi:hypothetical protein|nr:T9SS type A sorting domain-containing protein [Bacteroidales bacterium]MDD2632246.1 T9SS type A sorting domain-containing protein [Bacteroidales bacterium]MDD3131843.1 T9SS type A sorting domain-containing protein [Bacteroidales bacterium]MDD3526445.1 T9SS type A sorting domain-containing protein [Bacteroidales bacterium]MDD4740945.1 T9SS type A sorting domain-containing protein [Bacteroidales bacterium]